MQYVFPVSPNLGGYFRNDYLSKDHSLTTVHIEDGVLFVDDEAIGGTAHVEEHSGARHPFVVVETEMDSDVGEWCIGQLTGRIGGSCVGVIRGTEEEEQSFDPGPGINPHISSRDNKICGVNADLSLRDNAKGRRIEQATKDIAYRSHDLTVSEEDIVYGTILAFYATQPLWYEDTSAVCVEDVLLYE